MTQSPSRSHAWLEIMRISNIPTALSNALAGAAVGASLAGGADPSRPWFKTSPEAWWSLAVPPLAYVAGMILNDAFDAGVDAKERPNRPIPSGRVGRAEAFLAGFVLLALALGAARLTGSPTVMWGSITLVGCVLLYDLVHLHTRASVLLLAACRAFAALVPLAAFHGEGLRFDRAVLALPLALAAWTLALSLLARGELSERMLPSRGIRISIHAIRLFFVLVCVGAFISVGMRNGSVISNAWVISALPLGMIAALTAQAGLLIAWRNRSETPRAVGLMIVCLALIDAMFVVTVNEFLTGAACLALALLADRAQRRFAAS